MEVGYYSNQFYFLFLLIRLPFIENYGLKNLLDEDYEYEWKDKIVTLNQNPFYYQFLNILQPQWVNSVSYFPEVVESPLGLTNNTQNCHSPTQNEEKTTTAATTISTTMKPAKKCLLDLLKDKEPRMEILKEALPKPQPNETAYYDLIVDLITRQEVYKVLSDQLPPMAYESLGTFTRAVISNILKQVKLRNKIKKILEYYQSKITIDGAGAEKLQWILKPKSFMKKLNVSKILYAIMGGKENMTGNIKIIFDEVNNYLKNNSEVIGQWPNFIFHRTYGEFAYYLLQNIIDSEHTPDGVKNMAEELQNLIDFENKNASTLLYTQ